MVEIKENYPAEYPYYQLVGDEDNIYIYTEWLAERLSKAVFDMLITMKKIRTSRKRKPAPIK